MNTTTQSRVIGVLGENTTTGAYDGSIKIDDFEYKVTVAAETKTSAKGAVYQEMIFAPTNGGPTTAGKLFRSDDYQNIENKPGIQLYVNHGEGREPESVRMTGFYKTTKKGGEPAKRPYYSIGQWRENPNKAPVTEDAPF